MFKDDFRKARIAAGLTAIAAAEELGVSRGTIANWEKGKTEPDELIRARVDGWLRGLVEPPPMLPGFVPRRGVLDFGGEHDVAPTTPRPAHPSTITSTDALNALGLSPEVVARRILSAMSDALAHGLDPEAVARRQAPVGSASLGHGPEETSMDKLTAFAGSPTVGPTMVTELAMQREPVKAEGGYRQTGLQLTVDLDRLAAEEARELGLRSKSEFTRWLLRAYFREKREKAAAKAKTEGA